MCPNCGTLDPRNYTIFSAPVLVTAGLALVITVAGWTLLGSVAVQRDVGPTYVGQPALEAEVLSRTAAIVLPVTRPRVELARSERPAESPALVPDPPIRLVTRFAQTWVNVRTGPSTSSPVTVILDPGDAIQVGESRAGWWRVYREGDALGYVANSVLGRSPPVEIGDPLVDPAR